MLTSLCIACLFTTILICGIISQEDEKKEKNLSRALELFLKVNDLETEHKGDEVVW